MNHSSRSSSNHPKRKHPKGPKGQNRSKRPRRTPASQTSGQAPTRHVYKSRTVKPDYTRQPDRADVDEQVHGVRINKFLASFDVASRRRIDQWIDEGRITVNGRRATHGQRVRRSDDIRIDGEVVGKRRPKRRYILLHKPRGVVCTMDRDVPGNLADYLGLEGRIYPVGRLDKESTGLLLLTNDGRIVNPILREQFAHRKVYDVTVHRPITDAFCRTMAEGVRILGRHTKPAEVEPLGVDRFRITLTQGLNRQIRRMCESLGYEVVALKRIQIMHIGLQGLPEGAWRDLTRGELTQLEERLADEARALEEAAVEELEGPEGDLGEDQ